MKVKISDLLFCCGDLLELFGATHTQKSPLGQVIFFWSHAARQNEWRTQLQFSNLLQQEFKSSLLKLKKWKFYLPLIGPIQFLRTYDITRRQLTFRFSKVLYSGCVWACQGTTSSSYLKFLTTPRSDGGHAPTVSAAKRDNPSLGRLFFLFFSLFSFQLCICRKP